MQEILRKIKPEKVFEVYYILFAECMTIMDKFFLMTVYFQKRLLLGWHK